MLQPKGRQATTLVPILTALLWSSALAGCSFDASKLRAPAARDAAASADRPAGPDLRPNDPEPDALVGVRDLAALPDLAEALPDTPQAADAKTGGPEDVTGLDVPAVSDSPVDATAKDLDGAATADAVDDRAADLREVAPEAEPPSDASDTPAVSDDARSDDLADSADAGLASPDTADGPTGAGGAGGTDGFAGSSGGGGTGGSGGASPTGGANGTGGMGGGMGGTATADASADATIDVPPTYAMAEYPLPTPSCEPWHLVADPDGALWITLHATGKIAKFSVANLTFSEYSATSPANGIDGIAFGPDGNLWFTENTADYVGCMTTAGVSTRYALPFGSAPNGIVAGSDGAMWFTEMSGNRIGRITTAGVLTEYPVPTANSQPARIIAGPDGDLWFTEYNAGRLAHISAGTSTTRPIGSYALAPAGYPSGIANGPDSSMWIYQAGNNRVVRATTAATWQEYPLAASDSLTTRGSIVLGPDGNLWVTEWASDKIARVTPSGSAIEIALPRNSNPSGIVAGPDGKLWFVEAGANKLVSLTP